MLTVRDGALVEDVWRGGSDTSRLGFSLAPSAQHQHQVANAATYIWYPPLPEDWPHASELEAVGDVASPEALTLDVLVDAEQVPNPDSRVTLDEELDQVGVPRARVDWRLADLDRRTLSAAANILGAEFDRLGLGQLRPDRWIAGPDRDWALYIHDVFHHAGTTRMARDPSAGVTDSDCRVHGIANLYVSGSSVFPTSGHANPTLTIVALALRLADRLAGVLA